MLAKLLCTKRKSASAPRCLRCLGATIDIVNSITRTANRSGQGVFSHRCLRKANTEDTVITGLGGLPGITVPGQALAPHDLAPLIHPYCVKQALCDVNPEYAHLLFPWTRLLSRHGFIGLRNHCGSSKSIRTGAGPFHYDPRKRVRNVKLTSRQEAARL